LSCATTAERIHTRNTPTESYCSLLQHSSLGDRSTFAFTRNQRLKTVFPHQTAKYAPQRHVTAYLFSFLLSDFVLACDAEIKLHINASTSRFNQWQRKPKNSTHHGRAIGMRESLNVETIETKHLPAAND